MRTRSLATLGILVLVAGLVVGPPAAAHHAAGPCDFHRKDGETVEHFSKRHIRCSVRRFGAIAGGAPRAICIARRESGLRPDASSATGKYLGLFQQAASYWPDRYATYTRPIWELPSSALKGRTNAIVTIRMVRALGGWKAAGWRVKGC